MEKVKFKQTFERGGDFIHTAKERGVPGIRNSGVWRTAREAMCLEQTKREQ